MAVTKVRLLGHRATATVRTSRAAVDVPAVGAWTPDNLNAAEVAGGVVADDVTLDAREWDNVWLTADFVDGTGAPHAGGTVGVTMLLSTYDSSAPLGRRWKAAHVVASMDSDAAVPLPVTGHDVAVRIDAIALGGAAAVHLRVTGGQRLAQ